MTADTPNPAQKPENAKDEQKVRETLLEDAVDPRDLVLKGTSTSDPHILASEPALTPETNGLTDPGEVTEGFKFDRDED